MMERRWLVAVSCITLLLTACGGPKSKQDIAEELSEAVTLINYMDRPGHGTGFFVRGSKDVCTVVTARHVVAPSNQLQLQTVDGKLWQTSNIESFPNYDLAVVTFEPETWKKKGKTWKTKTCPYRALEMGDSDRLKDGDTIYLRGFPAGQVSRGVSLFSNGTVSGIVKPPILAGYGLFYQATTADGMSGGPVVNVDGKVIGVHGRTDTEIISIVNSPQSNLSPAEKARVEKFARIDNFKWGVPINVYKKIKRQIDAKIYLKQGDELYEKGQYSEAIASYNKAEAIASYDKAIKIKPYDHKYWYKKGYALNRLQRYSEAIASYEKAIVIKPDESYAWNDRGVALVKLQRYSEAIASYEKAIKIKPYDSYAWHNRGIALEKLERYDEALESYDKAIKFDPNNQVAINNRQLLLKKQSLRKKQGLPTQYCGFHPREVHPSLGTPWQTWHCQW